MKADDELYCWILEWRDEMQRRESMPPYTKTIFGTFVHEANQALEKCDQQQDKNEHSKTT